MPHRLLAAATLALFGWTPASEGSDPRPEPETWASVESTAGPRWHGRLEAKGTKLTLTESGGKAREIDPSTVTLFEFNQPRFPTDTTPLKDGGLPAPWKATAVGDIPHGGTAAVKNGSMIVETSAPDSKSDFSAFYMAYRPLPAGDSHITARVSRIDTYEENTKGGIMIRDGTGIEARNIFLALSHRKPASMRHWKRQGGSTRTDLREDSRPGHWLRLVRKGGEITGYVSHNGAFWRQIWSVEDELEGEIYACLAGSGRKPRRRWATVFDHVGVGPLEELGNLYPLEAKIALVDGTIFTEQIRSATETLLHLGGDNAGRAVPWLTVARIEFYYPLPAELAPALTGKRRGVLLPDGDFFECDPVSITEGILTVRSSLFGAREFDLSGAINALVLRPASKEAPPGLPYTLETWRGGRLYGKSIRIEDGQLAIETVRLRTQRFPLNEIRRVTKSAIR